MTRTEGILPALETAHAIAALPQLLAGIEGAGDPFPDDALVLLGFSGRGDKDLAALERFADVGPWADVAMTIDELRAFCLGLPGHPREGDLGRRRARRRRHLPGEGQDLPDHGPGGRRREHPDLDRPAGGAHRRLPRRPSRAPPYVGRFGWVSVKLDLVDPELLRGVIEGAWRRTAPKAVVAEFDAAAR